MRSIFKNPTAGIPIVVAAGAHFALSLSGFSAWVNATPAAPILRVLVMLLFGVAGFALLIWPTLGDPNPRPVLYRLCGLALLVIALAQASMLLGDPLHIRPE